MTAAFKLHWTITQEESGKLLRDFLKDKGISKTALTDIKFKGGHIFVNEAEENVRFKLKAGDKVTVVFPPEVPSEGMKGELIPLNILYEDEFIIVINKPAGMSTIPSREHPAGSLANALIGYYKEKGIAATSHIVTRLDRDTSGVVLVAKHRHVHHLFSLQQKAGLVKRMYVALAEGKVEERIGTIDAPIGRKENSIIEREVREDGQRAVTHYNVLCFHSNLSFLELVLETGRTHQIRVHLSSIGHPIAGDDLYGGRRTLINRQALHCKKINFFHPFNEQAMAFEADLPHDMELLLIQGTSG